MQTGRTRLINHTAATVLMLLATVTIAAVTLHGWQMHQSSIVSQRQSLQSIAAMGAAQLSGAAGQRPAGQPTRDAVSREFVRWFPVALRQPRVWAIYLRDADGQVLLAAPQEAGPLAVLATIPVGQPAFLAGRTRRSDEVGASPTLLVSHPIAVPDEATLLGDLIVIAERRSLLAAWAVWSLTFGVPLAGVAALGFVVGLRWLRRQIHQPLDDLIRRLDEDESAWLARLPINRSDEFGRIARGTEAMASELGQLRDELDDLGKTMDSRVAEQTRAINQQLKSTQRQVWLDPLTELGNRRLLDERLEQIFTTQSHASGDLVAIMFDIDHFKAHNDTMGHAAGDDLLRFFGQLLKGSLRQTDLAFRYAGDEFLILLVQVNEKDATQLAQRIVRLFAQQTSLLKTRPQPTLSAGIAALQQCGACSGQNLIQTADAALYRAKAKGRNTVSVAGRGTNPTRSYGAVRN